MEERQRPEELKEPDKDKLIETGEPEKPDTDEPVETGEPEKITGKHNIYLVFERTGFNLDYFRFNAETTGWTDTIPERTDADTYRVWYKLNAEDAKLQYVDVPIAPADITVKGETYIKLLVYHKLLKPFNMS